MAPATITPPGWVGWRRHHLLQVALAVADCTATTPVGVECFRISRDWAWAFMRAAPREPLRPAARRQGRDEQQAPGRVEADLDPPAVAQAIDRRPGEDAGPKKPASTRAPSLHRQQRPSATVARGRNRQAGAEALTGHPRTTAGARRRCMRAPATSSS